jgi:RNA polymerase sigma-70 factor (ECF subfamily)
MHNETDVIAGLHNGDPAALKVIWTMYRNGLILYGSTFNLNSDEIEEIVSDTFLTTWLKRPAFESYKHVGGFLFVTVKNKCINRLTQYKKQISRHKEYAIYQQAGDDEKPRIENLLSLLAPYIEKLPPQGRQVLKLIVEEGLTDEEIAKRLNITTGNVQTIKSESIKKLKELLTNEPGSGFTLLTLLFPLLTKLITIN